MKHVVVFLISTFFAISAFAEFSAAVVDIQKAIMTSDLGKKAKKELEGEFEKKKSEFKKKEEDLKKRAEEYEKKKMVFSDEVRAEKGGELQQDMMKFREDVNKSQMQMQQKQGELTKPILDKIQKVIADIAKEKGYSVVLERSEQGVMWSKAEIDITEDVIKKINK